MSRISLCSSPQRPMGIASSPYTERRRSVRGPRMLGALGLEGTKKTLIFVSWGE